MEKKFESMFVVARRVLAYYWKSNIWQHLPPTPKALKNAQAGGIDPLEVLRSYHFMCDKHGIKPKTYRKESI